MTYKEKLDLTRVFYPFDKWRELFEPKPDDDWDGMPQYSPENCDKTQKVLDDLINTLVEIGEQADEKQKVELFKKAIIQLNVLNQEIEGLIETGEREDLCELFDQIIIAIGLNPKSYANGEGICDLWRKW